SQVSPSPLRLLRGPDDREPAPGRFRAGNSGRRDGDDTAAAVAVELSALGPGGRPQLHGTLRARQRNGGSGHGRPSSGGLTNNMSRPGPAGEKIGESALAEHPRRDPTVPNVPIVAVGLAGNDNGHPSATAAWQRVPRSPRPRAARSGAGMDRAPRAVL